MWFIYLITNLINKKVYIGQSINPNYRWSRHKSNVKHPSKYMNLHLYNAMKQYGIDNFKFEIIAQSKTLDGADECEIACISQYNSTNKDFGYNNSPGGQGKRSMSEETREKLSKIFKGRPSPMKGKTLTAEHKEKISQNKKGNKYRLGVVVSKETKDLLSKINTGKVQSDYTRKKRSKSMIGKNAGKNNGMFGKRPNHAKLTQEQALSIRKEYKSQKISMKKLSEKYNVSKRTVLNIIHERIYK